MSHARDENATAAAELAALRAEVATLRAAQEECRRTREALSESTARLQAVLDTAACAICTIDEHGLLHSFNLAAERMFGYAEAEVVGQNVSLLMHEPSRANHDDYLQRYLASGEPRVIGKGRHVEGRRRDGAIIPVDLAVGEVHVQGRRMFTGIMWDVSEQQRAEEVLRETEERYRTMQAQFTELERVAVAGEMAAIAAHEIRTPLNAMSINVQMTHRLLRRGGTAELERAMSLLTTLQGEIERINGLLEDYLRTLRRPSARTRGPVDVNAVVLEAIRFIEPQARRRHVALHPALADRMPELVLDQDHLRQVLLNILLNAVQAMPGGGEAFVSTAADRHMARIAIRDTGPGIPEGDLERIFRPFVTTKEKGTGLGLPICERLVREMGGQLAVTSPPGQGATFEVLLPIEPRE